MKVILQFTNPSISKTVEVDTPFYFKWEEAHYKITDTYAVIVTDKSATQVPFQNVDTYLGSVTNDFNIYTNMTTVREYLDELARFYYYLRTL